MKLAGCESKMSSVWQLPHYSPLVHFGGSRWLPGTKLPSQEPEPFQLYTLRCDEHQAQGLKPLRRYETTRFHPLTRGCVALQRQQNASSVLTST